MSKNQTANWKAKGPFNYQVGVSERLTYVRSAEHKPAHERSLPYADKARARKIPRAESKQSGI